MDTTHTDSPDNFPCQCHLSQYAYEDALCPECEERERQLEAQVEAEALRAEAMEERDWDADNDWLASAGWGEM
jgi:hypothetical protein